MGRALVANRTLPPLVQQVASLGWMALRVLVVSKRHQVEMPLVAAVARAELTLPHPMEPSGPGR
jgi:hypothetical protein